MHTLICLRRNKYAIGRVPHDLKIRRIGEETVDIRKIRKTQGIIKKTIFCLLFNIHYLSTFKTFHSSSRKGAKRSLYALAQWDLTRLKSFMICQQGVTIDNRSHFKLANFHYFYFQLFYLVKYIRHKTSGAF